jgi:signal transduction histidine kinase
VTRRSPGEISEQTIAWARLVVVALLAIYLVVYDAPLATEEPRLLLPAGLAILAALIGLSLLQLRTPGRGRGAAVAFVLADGALTMAFVALFAFDPQKHLFAVSFGVVLEAATLLGLRPALLTWAALSVAYVVKEALGYRYLDVPTEPVGVLIRLVMLAGIALTTGSLVEANRATRAFSQEREETERLRDLDEMKTAFLAAVSHDLKNPLTAILGFSTTLEARLERLSPATSKEFLGRITNSARKLQRMLDDLLDVDRMERGTLETRRVETDLAALVRRTIEETDVYGRSVTIEAGDVIIPVDPPKVERILENLVANAVKYTPVDTPIDVRVRCEDGGALIAVEDRGPGIPDDQKAAVFDPFHRLPGADKVARGTGVGLSLVSSFAELHGGRAWIENRPGGGASFRVFLPAADASAPSN